jgi:hypothetical protein
MRLGEGSFGRVLKIKHKNTEPREFCRRLKQLTWGFMVAFLAITMFFGFTLTRDVLPQTAVTPAAISSNGNAANGADQ